MPAAEFVIKAILTFLAGSIPFASIAVRVFGKKDIGQVGEGNPGTANAFRACGPLVGIPVLLLDFHKGVLPLRFFIEGASCWQLSVLAIMPVLGHAFSPWLGFRGGKAITTSFGIWAALTIWEGPTAMGAGALVSHFLMKGKSDFLKALPIIICLGIYLVLTRKGTDYWGLYLANVAVLLMKQAQYAALEKARSARKC